MVWADVAVAAMDDRNKKANRRARGARNGYWIKDSAVCVVRAKLFLLSNWSLSVPILFILKIHFKNIDLIGVCQHKKYTVGIKSTPRMPLVYFNSLRIKGLRREKKVLNSEKIRSKSQTETQIIIGKRVQNHFAPDFP